MSRAQIYRGRVLQGETPQWQPLLDLVGEAGAGDFMWMFEVRLSNGTKLQAYKHIDTRRYLHLATDGRAFVFQSPDHYRLLDTPMDVYGLVYAYQHRDR
jgi:hypothetical protein